MEKTDRAVLDLTDRHGRYALHYAAGMGDEDGGREMFDWLKSFGADEHKADEVRRLCRKACYERAETKCGILNACFMVYGRRYIEY